MMQFDRLTIGRQAKELGYVRDTFEKVCRLVDVLSFIFHYFPARAIPVFRKRNILTAPR
jgi:hypothetical protein